MAGRGPAPKDPSTRARRNRKPSRATLAPRELRSVEELTDLTVAELRARIAELNLSRPADQQLDTRGTKAVLAERIIAAESDVPALPEHPPMWVDGVPIPVEWHTQAVSWWHEAWTSPMRTQWDESDYHNVCIIALLYHDMWTAFTPKERKEAAAEIRQQRTDLGLAPLPRNRLEWTIEGADEAKARGDRRRQSAGQPGAAAAPRPTGTDPRHGLTSVK